MRKIIIPALIAKTQEELDHSLCKVGGHADLLQLDIMDGKFVPNASLDFDFRLPERKYKFEAHLMIVDPEEWIKKNWKKADTLIAHIESVKNPEKLIQIVRDKGQKVGFALNPETPVSRIADYLDLIDQVLVMTVNPGFYGSKFLPETMDKVRKLRQLREGLDIEVDGGIKPDTICMPDDAGANLFVSGSYLIHSDNFKENMENLYLRIKVS